MLHPPNPERALLAEPDRIDELAEKVVAPLAEGRRFVLVQGGFGAGRSSLCRALVERDPTRFVVADILDLREPEAGLDGLYLAAAELESEEARKQVQQDWPSLADGLRCLARHFSGQRVLVLSIPDSWEGAAPDRRGGVEEQGEEEGEWVRQRAERARELLGAVAATRDLQVVLVGPPALATGHALKPDISLSLHRPKARRDALTDASRWGSYASAAAALHTSLVEGSLVNPVVLRLAVGAVGLGVPPYAVCEEVHRGDHKRALRELSKHIAARLMTHQAALQAVQRLLLPRRPLPRAKLLEFVQPPPEHAALITECIGDGGMLTRVHPMVRSTLGARVAAERLAAETDHASLARLYGELDGQPRIWQTSKLAALCWIERHHHESQCIEAPLWNEEELPAREFFWDRARAISLRARDEQRRGSNEAAVDLFRRAAGLYQRCRELFPPVDAYTAHYEGYNLDNAGIEGAEASYREAVHLDPSNPWWNARLVSFLLRDGRPRAAKRAWEQALEAIDPNGDRLEREPSIAFHLHHWVARAWLDVGRPREAAQILARLPARVLRSPRTGDTLQSGRVQRLWQLIHHVTSALEAEALGQSVYPSHALIAARWRPPEEVRDDSSVERWFPGRVTRVLEDRIEVVYAVPHGPGPDQEVLLTSFSRESWAAEAGSLQATPDLFVFLICRREDRREVRRMRLPRLSREEPLSRDDAIASLQAMKQWLSP